MEILAGDYGLGRLIIDQEKQELLAGQNKRIPFSSIVSVVERQITNSSNTKGIGLATAAGFLLTGPVGGLAGLALGAISEQKGFVIFEISLVNSEFIMVRGSYDSYGRIRGIIGENSRSFEASAAIKDPWRSKAIFGRAYRCAPDLPFDELKMSHIKRFEVAPSLYSIYFDDFFKLTIKYAENMNDTKWRYFDSVLSNREIERCAIFALSDLWHRYNEGGDLDDYVPYSQKPVLPESDKIFFEEAKGKFFWSYEQKRALEEANKRLECYNIAVAEWENEERQKMLRNRDKKRSENFERAQSGNNYAKFILAHQAYHLEVWDNYCEIEDSDEFHSDFLEMSRLLESVDIEFDDAGERLYSRIDVNIAFQAEFNEFMLGLFKRYISTKVFS